MVVMAMVAVKVTMMMRAMMMTIIRMMMILANAPQAAGHEHEPRECRVRKYDVISRAQKAP